MKKPMNFLLLGLLVFVLFSCGQETIDLENPVLEQEKKGPTLFNIATGEVVENFTMPSTASIPDDDLSANKSSNNAHVSGHFSAEFENDPTKPITFTFSVHETNGGINGQGKIKGYWDFHFDSYCIGVNGNTAVYGGIITAVIDNAGRSSIAVGNYIYFSVIDNGEGVNAAPDEASVAVLFAPFEYCAVFTGIPWSIFGGYYDMDFPDQVQVK